MVSLKGKRGFTIVELLIVIVVIAILATLVIVTFTGIQQKARDSQRQTDINALDSHIEAFFASNGYYPTLNDLQTGSWVSANLKGLDPQALLDPKAAPTDTIAGTATSSAYGYSTTGCTTTSPSSSTNQCTAFTLTADLEGNSTPFTKSSNT
ncbi:MAG TPA: type II secretion system protein [Candidatus Saccharimonadales bacterium]|nr:type II secretion system protein [Candidatus Saccharimonadales bacterium]